MIMSWSVSNPVALSRYDHDVLATNRALVDLSRHILWNRPPVYVRWIKGNILHSCEQHAMVNLEDAGTFGVVLAGLIGLVLSLNRYRTTKSIGNEQPRSFDKDRNPLNATSPLLPSPALFHELHVFFWIVFFFTLLGSLLVILVEPASGRYMATCSILFPGLLGLVAKLFFESVYR